MSVDMAISISEFFKLYDIKVASIMGGEFFCNPDWLKIFEILLPNLNYCRLVTNGDWAKDDTFLKQLSPYKDKLSIAISEDKWHSNLYTQNAIEQCEEQDFVYTVPSVEMQHDTILVPVGRLEGDPSGIYGMFSTYCSNPIHHYSFLIDEIGDIFKCSFGKLKYTNIMNHLDGTFPEKFKKFNQNFYNKSPMNCYQCNYMF